MSLRSLIGPVTLPGGATVSSGRLVFEILSAPSGETGIEIFAVESGAIVDRETGEPVYIVAPATYRVTLNHGGRRYHIASVGVTDDAGPVAWEDILAAEGSDVTVHPEIVRENDDITRLRGDSGEAGYVPIVQADKSVAWGAPGDAVAGVASVDGMTGVVTLPNATPSTAGKMSAADKSKLEGIAAGATVNSADAQLRDRSTHTGQQAISTVTDLQAALDGKASASHNHDGDYDPAGTAAAAVTAHEAAADPHPGYLLESAAPTAVAAALAADPSFQEIANRLAADWADAFDLEAMPPEYDGANTDGAKLQWIVQRLTLTNNDDPTERNITVLVPQRVWDVSAMPFQEEGSLGTYVFGTLYGACTQILLPNPGELATRKWLTLTFRAKQPSMLAYSVVNGDGANAHVLGTNAVIYSSATPPAGEGGNYSMIGASRVSDAYANTHLAPINVRCEGVTFRVSGGLTAFDGNHCASIEGPHWMADTGVASQSIHNYDPRRNADGTAYTGGTEIEFRKRQFGIKTPLLWNGSRMWVGLVETMGFRYGLEWNENLTVQYHFANYDVCANKVRGMSHVATLFRSQTQRCRRQFEGPEANDWNGEATTGLLNVYHMAGEAYHPGEYGNPAGDRWYSHEARIWDPENAWLGDIFSLYESPAEQPPTWVTLPSGHGSQLSIRRMGDAWGAGGSSVDFLPEVRTLTDGATITLTADSTQREQRDQVTLGDTGRAFVFADLADGMEGTIAIKQDATGNRTITSWTASGFTIAWKGGSAPTLTTTAYANDLVRYEVVGTIVYAEFIAWAVIEVGGGGTDAPDVIFGADLVGWWKADDLAGSEGSEVLTWTDKVTGGLGNMTANTGFAPLLRTNALNGKKVLEFNATSSQLAFPDPSALTGAEVWIVVKCDTDPPAGINETGFWNITGDAANVAHFPFTDGNVYDNFGSTTRRNTGNPAASLSAAYRLYNVTSVSGEWTSRIDGTQHYTTATNTVGWSSTPRKLGSNTSHFFDGRIAEMFIVNRAATTDERNDVIGYINDQYGLGL